MQWRFWKRGKKKNADESATEPLCADAGAFTWPASAGAKEILGLQQLVGNQAVLRLLAKDVNGAAESEVSENRKRKRGWGIWNCMGWERSRSELR
jgi:hypothetical protein